ncbi:(2Fe-2S)-binding protein [Kaistia algarum]|uniref:(2Fe-2S)-binding protein n=1 Tax=Kaistia algarum TaxID=2083279 RepID=UPI000CE73F4F|nr:(2Fe-2S)-binding protein [Kaistia algarum]MCX5516285.1 (2Fe-2S)-binding protein [Kaistia algarum]PPE78793.1 (2Fe-2S)-binding protein [Kaistia algarum]
MSETIAFRLNGTEVAFTAAPDTRLIDLIREEAGATATKAACRIGRCGSCLVLKDGEAVNSCLVMAYQLEGTTIVSAEGLAAVPAAEIVRAALIADVSFQCGYCAPGFTIALTALLSQNPAPDDEAIHTALEGNICRCTGYLSILRGAKAAVAALAGRSASEQDNPS